MEKQACFAIERDRICAQDKAALEAMKKSQNESTLEGKKYLLVLAFCFSLLQCDSLLQCEHSQNF